MIWSTSHPQAVADGWLTDGAVVKEGSARRRIARIGFSRGSSVARGPTEPYTTTLSLLQHCSTTIFIYYNVNINNMKEDILGVVTVYARL